MSHSEIKPNSEQEEVVEDDWNLPCDFFLFEQHIFRPIQLPNSDCIQIACVEALTPLDMLHLGSGEHDSTGNCVWLGALLLIRALPKLETIFNDASVVELGCGTGIGGVAVSKYCNVQRMRFTDADPDALDLCRKNMNKNGLNDSKVYSTVILRWDQHYNDCLTGTKGVVLATDVIYDIRQWPNLLRTASRITQLCTERYWIVAHVPRACYTSERHAKGSLEDYLMSEATNHSWTLKNTIHPTDIASDDTSFHLTSKHFAKTLKEMGEVGATVFVWVQKQEDIQPLE